jgi:hypothetical protein
VFYQQVGVNLAIIGQVAGYMLTITVVSLFYQDIAHGYAML